MYYILFDTYDSTYFVTNFTPSSKALSWTAYKDIHPNRIQYLSDNYSDGSVEAWLDEYRSNGVAIPIGTDFPSLSSIPSPSQLREQYPEYFL